MLGLRPKPSDLYMERPRLLRQLPQDAGYVVWLEAPYGYGKSVLAAQWASSLEQEQWRILWLSLEGRDAKSALAELLNLPNFAPWGVVIDALWQKPSLLVLEDLTSDEDLSALFKSNQGLILLASRKRLVYPDLPKLLTTGALFHITAEQLAFSLEEAETLFVDPKQASELWQQTQGWSLPLHFAALTGEVPERTALLKGIKASLSEEAWEEALFLAALPYLPSSAATKASQELTEAGFVQVLEQGFRLHALAAESLVLNYLSESQAAVKKNVSRLPLYLRAEAFSRSKLSEELSSLLDEALPMFEIDNAPELFIELCSCLSHSPSVHQRYNLAIAEGLVGKLKESSQKLMALANEIQHARPNDAMFMLGLAAYDLADIEPELALKASESGIKLINKAPTQQAIPKAFLNATDLFLNNASRAHWRSGDFTTAEAYTMRALELIAADRDDRVIALANVAHLRWLNHGDIEGYIHAIEAMIPFSEQVATYNLPYLHLELGSLKLYLGRFEESKDHFTHTVALATNPLERLQAEAQLAFSTRDSAAFPSIVAKLKNWEHPDLDDKVMSLWSYCLLDSQHLDYALEMLATAKGFNARLVKALCYSSLNRSEDAFKILPEMPPATERGNYLAWQAIQYRVSKNPEHLNHLVNATLSREKILTGLIPFDELKQEKPEFSLFYPLEAVLKSSWQKAIELRKKDIPPLELNLLGRFEVKLLGEEVEFTDRLKQILCLLALDYSRDEIAAAMWPEADTKKSRNNLNVQLNLLRKAIEPWGLSTYLFESGLKHTCSDVYDLQLALDQSNANSVLTLYQEPFARGLDLNLVQDVRETLRQDVLSCLFESSTSPATARAFLERILELDPTHEEALQLLLKDLVKAGRKREAKKRYQQFAEALKTEMRLEPLEETRALLET